MANEVIVEPTHDILDEFLEDEVNFTQIDSLSESIDTSKDRYRKYKPKEYIRTDPLIPENFYASLTKNSKLVKLDGNDVFYNERKVYVKAREIYYGGKWSYILAKDGSIKYKTYTKNLTSVQDIIKLRSTIPASKTYPMKTQNHTSDKALPLETHILFRNDTSNLSYVGQNLGYTDGNANSSTISLKLYYKSFLPIDFGLVMDYQYGVLNFEDSSESIWNAAYFGPTAKYTFYDRGSFALNTQIAVKKSFFFNASDNGQRISFSTLLWQVGLEALYKTKYGNLSLGYENSFIRSSVNSELPGQAPIQPEKTTMTQNSFSIGYQFTWNL